jgi:hypothetical protein
MKGFSSRLHLRLQKIRYEFSKKRKIFPTTDSDVRREKKNGRFDQKDENLLNGLLVDDKRQIGWKNLALGVDVRSGEKIN